MKINLLAFGIAKDILGKTEQELEWSGGDINALKFYLLENYPAFQKLQSLRLAVNQEYRSDDFGIKEGDEVAIIPPVSGG
jgi:molybdopterin synthase sulfur carrier subunit